MKRAIRSCLLTLVLLCSFSTINKLYPADFTFTITPAVNIPLQDDIPYGFTGFLQSDLNLFGFMTLGLEGNYSIFKPNGFVKPMQLFGGGLDLGLYFYPFSRLYTGIGGGFGANSGIVNVREDGGIYNTYNPTGFYYRGYAELGFRFSPSFILTATGGYLSYVKTDFSTFNKHLFLKDNDFLYAKRVGGPVDYILCSYQDINKKSKMSSNVVQLKKKKLDPIKRKANIVEYITISKNTVLHYQKGVPVVYSIQEWIDNYNKYKLLMKIPLFKNFRNAKLFDSWRRFYRKTKRQYYTEKLKKNFFFVDRHLLNGILETRTALKPMSIYNIFDMKLTYSVLLNKFNELHKYNLMQTDKKINSFRSQVKSIISTACNNSYQEYKTLKKITLEDNTMVGSEEKGQNITSNNNSSKDTKKKDNDVNIQNFIKNAIPYAQDATRKTHYKKLLRYIRVMDYIFNEAKFTTIQFSLELLVKKFKRLYECYLHHWVDPPMIITKILCFLFFSKFISSKIMHG